MFVERRQLEWTDSYCISRFDKGRDRQKEARIKTDVVFGPSFSGDETASVTFVMQHGIETSWRRERRSLWQAPLPKVEGLLIASVPRRIGYTTP